MSLGRALKALRRERGMTLAELASKVDSHVGNLSRIERDQARPSIDLLYRIAGALDYRVSEIFAVVESEESDQRLPALNAIFLALLDHDRALLLDFARMLKERSERYRSDFAADALPSPDPDGCRDS